MAQRNYQITPYGTEWVLTQDGKAQPISLFKSKQEALNAARTLAGRYHIKVIVHTSNEHNPSMLTWCP